MLSWFHCMAALDFLAVNLPIQGKPKSAAANGR